MFFRLPVVRFFNRVINRATVTVALVLLQIGWLLWAFFSLTAGKVWVNAGLNVLSLFITLYLVRKDENSDYKIIWLVLIGMMPLLGGALYLAFGNKAPAKRMRQRMQAVERQHTADLAQQPGQTDALDPASRGLSRYVSEYGPYPAWKTNHVSHHSSPPYQVLLPLPDEYQTLPQRFWKTLPEGQKNSYRSKSQ